MSAVLRIALTFFEIVPVQRWVNGAGLILIVLGALGLFVAETPGGGGGGFVLVLLGAVLIVLTPVFSGGVALRFASTRTLLHLRPNGRIRLLLGATLALTLLAALVALPSLSMQWFLAHNGLPATRRLTDPLDAFMVSWSVLAVGWICIFALSRSMLAMALLGFLPILVISLGKVLVPIIPGAIWVLLPGIACWMLFAAWYLRTKSVTRPEFPMSGDPSVGFDSTPIGRLVLLLGTPQSQPTPTQATHYYLFGTPSPWFFVLTGAFVALILVAAQVFTTGGLFQRNNQLVSMLPFMAFFSVSIGLSTTRRARFLWLRTGHDRAGLFRLAEHWGQRSAMLAWLAAATPFLLFMLLPQPERAASLLLFMATQAVMAATVYYFGMALTRGWNGGDILLGFVAFVLMIVQGEILDPQQEPTPGMVAGVLLFAVVAALLLRALAVRRWRKLDWRVARVPRLGAK